ncbi:MAG: acyl transferase [Taibaiella sp.]|nr:acyl transferase [Taibaiella sp.]
MCGIFDALFLRQDANAKTDRKASAVKYLIFSKLTKVFNKYFNSQEYIQSIEAGNFVATALALFEYQYQHNAIYQRFCNALNTDPAKVVNLQTIPYLPISFFKNFKVTTGPEKNALLVFESSRTSGDTASRHFVPNEELYHAALLKGFSEFYGDPARYTILALLPSYLERSNSSLVHMAQSLMNLSRQEHNGFYLNDFEKLANTLLHLEKNKKPTLLLGVTFALLDFAEQYPLQLEHTTIMETGGMKGRREEWTREQVHDFLIEKWGVPAIHSEYGMTELLSQAYSAGGGLFRTSSTMQVLVRDVNDPLDISRAGTGCINVADLANVDSCAFIATDDIGRLFVDDTFEVLGRADNSVLRGCSLMAL